jgi:hypothetical protein
MKHADAQQIQPFTTNHFVSNATLIIAKIVLNKKNVKPALILSSQ